MSRLFLLFVLICTSTGFSQDRKNVFVHVDVLGKRHSNVRYYHPVEGVYQLNQVHVELGKKFSKQFPGFVFIQPFDYGSDSSHIQANSLRHYVDPNELIYVNWDYGVDTTKNQEKLDRFTEDADSIRKSKYSRLIQEYFNPFFLKKYEVTNNEYRDFVFWVRDSMIREEIYKCDSIPKMVRLGMLNVPDEVKKNGIVDEAGSAKYEDFDTYISRGLYSFRQDIDVWKMVKKYPFLIARLEKFRVRPNERWYKRREWDVSKFKYNYYTVELESMDDYVPDSNWLGRSRYISQHFTPIYPDTLDWVDGKTYTFNDPLTNMYFWHPAYDNFPVVGVSYEQIQAFCHWKEKQIRRKFPDLMEHMTVGVPRTYEYEWAASYNQPFVTNMITQDQEILTNLQLGTDEKDEGQFHRAMSSSIDSWIYGMYTNKVYLPCDPQNKKCLQKIENRLSYIESKRQDRFHDLKKFNSALLKTRATQNRLASGVEFLSNNVSEWMEEEYEGHYDELIEAYFNYRCFSDVDYCQYQMKADRNMLRNNDKKGRLIMGGNWFDERYSTMLGVNSAGIYPKTFQTADTSFCTVGFRYVIRLSSTYFSKDLAKSLTKER